MSKHILCIAFCCFLFSTIFSQVPDKMPYQVVIRDGDGNLLANSNVGLRLSIYEGSEDGTLVYEQDRTVTTDTNGYVYVEIGGNAVFDTISWLAGPYYLKTEADLTGGSDYSVIGVSQLLSVPYARHAKTAQSFSHNIEQDPVFNAWNKDYNDLINKPDIGDSIAKYVDGSETKIYGGMNVTVSGKGTQLNPYNIKVDDKNCGSPLHYVGELYGGGIIFWVDPSGYHGLICSMVDISDYTDWSNVYSTEIGLTAQSDWDGLNNSLAVIAQNGHTNSAAKLCLDYTNGDFGTGIYSDWYLPSRLELEHLWDNFYLVEKTIEEYGSPASPVQIHRWYWTSTEVNNERAWIFDFTSGQFYTWEKKTNGNISVRAIRAF